MNEGVKDKARGIAHSSELICKQLSVYFWEVAQLEMGDGTYLVGERYLSGWQVDWRR